MNTDDYDVIEMDFPPYSADSFKLPDIDPEESFNENKNEIYLRNIAIAKAEDTRLAAAEKAERAAEKAGLERMYKSSEPAVKSRRKKINTSFPIVYLFGMTAFTIFAAILGNLIFDASYGDTSWQVKAAQKQALKVYIDCTGAAAKAADTTRLNYTIEGKDSEIYLGSTKADISEYRSYDDGYVYGSFSEGYGVDYVLWSETPIPVEYRHMLTEKETNKIAKKEGLVIGCYPLRSKDEAAETTALSSTAETPLDEKYKEVFEIQYDIASIEPLKNYPEEYEESGGKELAVTLDFKHKNIKNDMGTYALRPKVMCLDLGDSNYIKPFYGGSDNFEGAYDMSAIMFHVEGRFSVTYFVDADELRKAQGIAYRLSAYDYGKSKDYDVPNFKIAFDYGKQRTIYEYLENQKKEEEWLEAAPDMLELLKTTAVREPFEEADGETVYNNKAVSVKIEPSSVSVHNSEGFYLPEESMAEAKITIKNLTNYDYKIRPDNFSIDFDRDSYREISMSVSDYNERFAEYDENGELLLGFDENNLCSFTVTASGNNAFSYCYLKYDMPQSKKMQQDIDGFNIKIYLESQYIAVD